MRSSRAKPKSPVKRSSTNPAAIVSKKRSQSVSAQGEVAIALPAQAQVLETPVVETKQKSSWVTNILRVVALLAVIGISVYIYSIRDNMESFEKYGYFGIFVIALLANATVFVPAPGVVLVYSMGGLMANGIYNFNPFMIGLAAGTGGALGELSGYLAGFSGQAVIERTDVYERFKPWVDKYGGWAILVLSAIPNPFFDVAGIAAGISKMRTRTFLFSTWIGQLIKMTLFALAGRYSIEWITKLIG